jgi:cytochrome P450
MKRIATKDVVLSDGFKIPRGADVTVFSGNMWDGEVYADPGRWDPYRFHRLRQAADKENAAQLVSTSPEHLGFGHGKHACPGRFFAGNEIKVALCHLLLKYDWRLPEGADVQFLRHGFTMTASPSAKIMVRRREEEVPL